MSGPAAIDLYWLPLGAGGRFVRLNGRIFESIVACLRHRPRRALYHSALIVHVPDGRYVIEQAPVPDARGRARGVVFEGPVGVSWAARFRIGRYEVRRWKGGVIPDVAEAVESPRRLSTSLVHAERLLASVPDMPRLIWGRDQAGTGEMWNSNSIIAWLLVTGGVDVAKVRPPEGGRAPGWHAGIVVAEAGAGSSGNRLPRPG